MSQGGILDEDVCVCVCVCGGVNLWVKFDKLWKTRNSSILMLGFASTAITSRHSFAATYIDWSMTEYKKWETRSYKTVKLIKIRKRKDRILDRHIDKNITNKKTGTANISMRNLWNISLIETWFTFVYIRLFGIKQFKFVIYSSFCYLYQLEPFPNTYF